MSAHPDVPHMEFESVLRSSRHSELLVYRAMRNYRAVEQGRPYVARVWNRKGLADVERDRLVEVLGAMAAHQRSSVLIQIHEVLVDEQGRLVVVQEHLAGGSFRMHYRAHRFRLPEVLSFGIRLTAALTVLHRYMVHGRVDPSVVLFRSASDDGEHLGDPVLAGVEIAEVADSAGWGPWRSQWASPRVRSGDYAGDRSDDLYSVAALMCSALTRAEPPDSVEELPERLRPDVPHSLMQLLRLAMEPASRLGPVTAEMLLNRLWEVERECGFSRTPIKWPTSTQGFSVRRAGSESPALTDDDQRFGFGVRPVRIIEPPSGPVPGRVAPTPAGDPPGGPFPTIGRRPAP